MNMIQLAQFDGLLSFLVAFGLLLVLRRLHRSESLTSFEKKLYWILIYLCLLLVIRVPYIGFQIHMFFGPMTYMAASLFAFSVFLYFETLLRRHMPLWVKIFSSLGTVYFVLASL